jgi:penicillin-binding protein 1A
MSGSLTSPQPGRARRRADHPTAARAARASARATGRGLALLAGDPGRRWRRHQARVDLGAAVARRLAGQPAPAFLTAPLAAHRAAQLRLASTDVPSRNGRPPGAAPTDGSRANRSARHHRDVVAEVERLLLLAVQLLPRLAALVRLRVASARLGAWAVGLVDLPDPAVAGARERLSAAQRHAAEAGAAMTASRREALAAARTAVTLTGEALADVAGWVGRGLRVGAGMLWTWLVSLAVATGRGLRGAVAGLVAFLAGAAAAVLAAGHGTAAWIDARVARGRAASDHRHARRRQAADRRRGAHPAGVRPTGDPYTAADPRRGEAIEVPPFGVRNGRVEGAGVPVGSDDQGEATEPWWLPSHLGDPVEDGPVGRGRGARRRAGVHRRPADRDPVVAGLAAFLGRTARRLSHVVAVLAAPPDRRRPGWLPFLRPVAVALALALVAGTAAALPTGMLVAGSVKVASAGLPDIDELKPLRQPERTQIYDRNGALIEVLHDEQDRIVVPLERMSERLQQAVIAAEDARFYEHGGVDERGILRAALTNVLRGDVAQGGSTITQQLVRNAYPDLRERTLDRKIKEAALAAQLEQKFSKRQILEAYLNRVYFGAGYYGVETAGKGYFHKRASDVSLAQAATLAAIIREPETANPRQDPERARSLRDSVLTRMVDLGMVPAADAAKAKQQPLKVFKAGRVGGRYPWFVDGLRRQLEQDPRLGKSREQRVRRLFEGGLRIRTTLDRDLQYAAELAVRNHVPPSGRQQIALIAIDPRNGAVRAVVGGQNYSRNHYNVAVQGRGRQPGSSFKPFVLAAALDAGVSPDSVWESSGFQSDNVCGAKWAVDNYEGKGAGKISVREATWRSVNGVYARLMGHLCPAKVVAMAEKLGIHLEGDQARAPSIALGTAEVRPIDMASAYGVFANLGEYHRPTFVEKVSHHGDTMIEDPAHGERRISAALAWQVNDILKGVIAHGTGTAANIGRPEAGKTGTNQEYRDAWFVGYTPQLVTAVWMGDPKEQTPMLNVGGIRVTGGSYPAQVWHDFMLAAMANQQVLDWQKPPGELSYSILPPPPGEPKKKRKRKRPGPPGGR